MEIIPTRICCGQKHVGVVCPDGTVMCCYCFNKTNQNDLVFDSIDNKKWNVCQSCWNFEQQMLEQRGMQQ